VVGGGYDQFEFVRGMDGTMADLAVPIGAQDETSGGAHTNREGAGDGEEERPWGRRPRGDTLGALQGQRLWNQFARITWRLVISTKAAATGDGMRVDGSVGDAADPASKSRARTRFAEPAQSETVMVIPSCTPFDDAAEFAGEV